jgi:hypothetical protein
MDICQISHDTAGRIYYQRKRAEGQSVSIMIFGMRFETSERDEVFRAFPSFTSPCWSLAHSMLIAASA